MDKPVFGSVAEAKAVLAGDKLGSVWYSADKVFVATAQGTGTFSRAEWLAGDGPPFERGAGQVTTDAGKR